MCRHALVLAAHTAYFNRIARDLPRDSYRVAWYEIMASDVSRHAFERELASWMGWSSGWSTTTTTPTTTSKSNSTSTAVAAAAPAAAAAGPAAGPAAFVVPVADQRWHSSRRNVSYGAGGVGFSRLAEDSLAASGAMDRLLDTSQMLGLVLTTPAAGAAGAGAGAGAGAAHGGLGDDGSDPSAVPSSLSEVPVEPFLARLLGVVADAKKAEQRQDQDQPNQKHNYAPLFEDPPEMWTAKFGCMKMKNWYSDSDFSTQ